MSDFDLSSYLGLFKEDVADQLQRMTDGLLALEADVADRRALDELFRSAHTVKGSARMMGLGDIAELAHAMEDVLAALREETLAPRPELVSGLLSSLDLLKRMVDAAGAEAPLPPDYQPVLATLTSILEASNDGKQASAAIPSGLAVETEAVAEAQLSRADPSPQGGPAGPRQRDYLRVPVAKVDAVLDLASELATHRSERRQIQGLRELAAQVGYMKTLLSQGAIGAVQATVDQVARELESMVQLQRGYGAWQSEIVLDLHAEITRLRMLPLNNLFVLFQRSVRDLSLRSGKEVRLVTEGGDTEIDKLILEGLQEPLLHLVRNAVDHGIEPPEAREQAGKPRMGTISLTALQRGDQVEVTLSDDGRGLELETVRQKVVDRGLMTAAQASEATDEDLLSQLFVPGFSTSEQVTETSGRGVGLDAVRAAANELGGQIALHSRAGQGTRCVVSLPLTLAYTRALLVMVAGQVLALPAIAVESVGLVAFERISWLQGRAAVEVAGRTLPLVPLAEVLGLDRADRASMEGMQMIVAHSAGQRVAFGVDDLIGDEDLVVKPLGHLLREARFVAGGAILPEGRIALLLNVGQVVGAAAGGQVGRAAPSPRPQESAARRVLVVDDAATTRELERAILVAAGYEVETAVDGLDALERLGLAAYDAVVTDIEMPRMDGFELTQTLRRESRWREMPVIIVTTRESQEDRRRGLEAGAQAYLLKGAFDQENLVQVLGRMVG